MDEAHLVRMSQLEGPISNKKSPTTTCAACHLSIEAGRGVAAKYCRRPNCRIQRSRRQSLVSVRATRHKEKVELAMAVAMNRQGPSAYAR